MGRRKAEAASATTSLNKDGTYSVASVMEILPNRYNAVFADGTSKNTIGVYVNRSMDSLHCTQPRRSEGYIIGSCANKTYGVNSDGVITRLTRLSKRPLGNPTSTLKLNESGTEAVENDTLTCFDLAPNDRST